MYRYEHNLKKDIMYRHKDTYKKDIILEYKDNQNKRKRGYVNKREGKVSMLAHTSHSPFCFAEFLLYI